MKGLRRKTLGTLLKTVEYWREIKGTSGKGGSVMYAELQRLNWSVDYLPLRANAFAGENMNTLSKIPFIGTTYWDFFTVENGNVIVQFDDLEALKERGRFVGFNFDDYEFQRPYNPIKYKEYLASISGQEFDKYKFVERLYQISKLDKNNRTTLKNAIKAWATMVYMDERSINLILKDVANCISNYIAPKTVYVYVATDYIEHHYRWLKEHNNLKSCMTKGSESLHHTHYTPCDRDSAVAKKWRVKELTQKRATAEYGEYKQAVFTPNVACYNNSEEWGLLLFSYLSPEEVATAVEYPFIGRAVGVRNGKDWEITRYYGNEQIRHLVQNNITMLASFNGVKIRAYISNTVYARDNSELILPYVDGVSARVFRLTSDTIYLDEIGRPYYVMQVTDYELSDIVNHRLSENDKKLWGRLFILSTEHWTAHSGLCVSGIAGRVCAVTGEQLNERTGWQLEDGTLIWSRLRKFVRDKEDAKFLASIIKNSTSSQISNFNKRVESEVKARLESLTEGYKASQSHYQITVHNLQREIYELRRQRYTAEARANDLLRQQELEPEFEADDPDSIQFSF